MPIVVNKQNVLKQYGFYRQAAQALQDEIMEYAVSIILEPNTFFFEKGQRCEHIALIGSGSVRVYAVGETGREVTLYRVRPGETCPVNILSSLVDMRSPAIAIVEEPLEAVALPVGMFRKWVSEQSVVQQFVFEGFAYRLSNILTLMEVISFGKMDQRLAKYLLGQFASSDTEPPIAKVTHDRIAVELGSAREVISRLLGEFERAGTIELFRGRIVQKDKAMLSALVE